MLKVTNETFKRLRKVQLTLGQHVFETGGFTYTQIFFTEYWFPQGIYLGLGLLDHLVVLSLVF